MTKAQLEEKLLDVTQERDILKHEVDYLRQARRDALNLIQYELNKIDSRNKNG